MQIGAFRMQNSPAPLEACDAARADAHALGLAGLEPGDEVGGGLRLGLLLLLALRLCSIIHAAAASSWSSRSYFARAAAASARPV